MSTARIVKGDGGVTFIEETFTPTTNGQTVFALSGTHKVGGYSAVIVNGLGYAKTLDYAMTATTMTWTDACFPLATTDRVLVRYETV